MNGADDLARRIRAKLDPQERQTVTAVTDESGQVWLHIRAPEITPGEPGVIFCLPDKEREPLASIESGEPGVTYYLPDNGRGDGPLDRQK